MVDASNSPPIVFDNILTITGDTTVNGIDYIKIDNFRNSFLFRQDSIGKVFGRYADPSVWSCLDTNEILVYDFSLGVNDSIYIHSCFDDSVLCVVTSDDSILTNHGYRRKLNLYAIDGILHCNTGTGIKWIEGIGGMNDLFYNFNFY